MRVRELIQILQSLPPDMPVAVDANPRHLCGVRVQRVFVDAVPGQQDEAWLMTSEEAGNVA